MGLDMYLAAKNYVSSHSFVPDEEKEKFNRLLSAMEISPDIVSKDSPGIEVNITVAYWRKANQIHRWFISKCADGVDDYRAVYVPAEKLQELRDLCASLLANKDEDEARRKLPPMEGFFFGGYEINDWYWKNLESTVEQLDKVLPLVDEYDIYYRASW